MKSFLQRVKDILIADKWQIKYTSHPFIDFISVRRGISMRKAYRVKAHGHLSHREQNVLYEYGRAHRMHVIYIHEVAGRELEFIRLYPRNQRGDLK